ncbi:hypothetical protein [Effusibacillus lacus]|nr:hypothetical protein [Effusibacillus lacus]TCS76519.1 hypothetical protein EDD64_10264 [Effusibacillus lacus]
MTEEQYAGHGYNSEALLRAAGIVGQEVSKDVNRMTRDEEHPEGALQYTYVQVMDSYREGTIDGIIENSANDANEIPHSDIE